MRRVGVSQVLRATQYLAALGVAIWADWWWLCDREPLAVPIFSTTTGVIAVSLLSCRTSIERATHFILTAATAAGSVVLSQYMDSIVLAGFVFPAVVLAAWLQGLWVVLFAQRMLEATTVTPTARTFQLLAGSALASAVSGLAISALLLQVSPSEMTLQLLTLELALANFLGLIGIGALKHRRDHFQFAARLPMAGINETVAITSAVVLSTVVAFSGPASGFDLHYLILIVVGWAALRLSAFGAVLTGLATALTAAILNVQGLGPFAQEIDRTAATDIAAQLFCVAVLLTAMIPSVVHVEVLSAQRQLRDYARRLRDAEREFRRRVAHELHDDIGQSLLAAQVALARAASLAQGDTLRTEICRVQDGIKAGQSSVTLLLHELHPSRATGADMPARLAALKRKLQDTHAFELRLTMDARSLATLSNQHAEFFWRSANELISNVVKHAGVGTAEMSLTQSTGVWRLVVADAGRGASRAPSTWTDFDGHFGLFSISEETQSLGGGMRIDSHPDSGTTVTLSVPA